MQPILDKLNKEIVEFFHQLPHFPITPTITPDDIRTHLRTHYDFIESIALHEIIDDVSRMMREWHLHSSHPRYFGLFNPTTGVASIVADTLVALYNSQLAAWSHAPAVNEIEQFVLKYLMQFFGCDPSSSLANFTTGGAEANLSGVLVALTKHFPEYGEKGLLALEAQPVMYVSEEAHDSFTKIAHITGLGRNALRVLPTDQQLKMNVEALDSQVQTDKSAGYVPFLVVGTAGTTGAGVIDPLSELAECCRKHYLWFHVDAAWGGAAALSPNLRKYLNGIDLADSITCDAHKWFSVPMGAGMFFCKDKDAVSKTFRVSATYMPGETRDTFDPYVTTIQWSRRFIGLKLFMTLAESGAEKFAKQLEHQTTMGDLLRHELKKTGWKIVNETPLPVVCFTHPQLDSEHLSGFLQKLYSQKNVWISETRLQKRIPALRACITSYLTQSDDIHILVKSLNDVL
jgi:glutamate/tyrosine decarboxylase-like PLP-dependent enzyme